MLNFDYQNPTRIVFGQGSTAKLARMVPQRARVLVLMVVAACQQWHAGRCAGRAEAERPALRGRVCRHRAEPDLRDAD